MTDMTLISTGMMTNSDFMSMFFLLRTIRGMYLLIYSGLLYLLGISIVLMLKPEIMFSADGKWKEFGIGRAKERYTWLPFWLFAIMWAIMSYMLVLVIASHTDYGSHSSDMPVSNEIMMPENVTTKSLSATPIVQSKQKLTSLDMKKGYYILNTEETMKKGIPKYIYLGPEAPNLVFHSTPLEE
jgi:hypothetical protein